MAYVRSDGEGSRLCGIFAVQVKLAGHEYEIAKEIRGSSRT